MANEQSTSSEWILKLNDEVSGGAKDAAEALDQLRESMTADTKELAALQKAMKNLQSGTVVDIKAAQQLRTAIDQKKQALAQAQTAYVQLGGKAGAATVRTRSFRDAVQAAAKEANGLPGPLGRMLNGLSSVIGNLTGAKVAMLALGAAAALTVVGVAKMTKSFFELGVAALNARRNELLHFEALTKMRNMWGIAPGKAKDMQDAVDRISASVSLGRDKVAGYAEQLYKSGLRGKTLETALEGAAIKGSALGEAAGSAFAGFASTIAVTGGSVKRFTEDAKNRFGGLVSKQMKSLEVQTLKQKEAIDSLFAGVSIEPYLNSMKRLRDLFSQNTESGRALKQIVGLLFKPLVSTVTSATETLRHFFNGIIIGVQEITIVLLQVKIWWARTFGVTQEKQVEGVSKAVNAGRVAVYLLATAFSALAIKLTLVTIPAIFKFAASLTGKMIGAIARALPQIGLLAGRFVGLAIRIVATVVPAVLSFAASLIGTLIGAVLAAIPMVISLAASFFTLAVNVLIAAAPFLLAAAAIVLLGVVLYELYTLWKEIDWADLGNAIWKGIVEGVSAGWNAVKTAVTELGTKAKDALKNFLGIASPSKVFAELGLTLPQGLKQGIEKGTPDAQDAAESMVKVPAPQPGGGGARAAAPAGGARGGAKITIGDIHLHVGETDNPRDMATAFRRELEKVLEGLSLEIGAAPVTAE